MNELCLTSSILYQATIKCSDNKYYANYKKSFSFIKSKTDTTLSIKYWNLKQKQQAPTITWEISRQYYNLSQKSSIIDDPGKNLLNKRSEVICQCRHRNQLKLATKKQQV